MPVDSRRETIASGSGLQLSAIDISVYSPLSHSAISGAVSIGLMLTLMPAAAHCCCSTCAHCTSSALAATTM
jgi:hypothetical protein